MPPAPQQLGYLYLRENFQLPAVPLPYQSLITGSPGWRDRDGVQERHWPQSAWPGEAWQDHLEFALKHEGLNLPLLWHLFRKIDGEALASWIAERPAGKYRHKAGFLYEWLTGQTLKLSVTLTGNYEPVLDADRYLVSAAPRANTRWRIHDNLPGTSALCPLIERAALAADLDWNPTPALNQLRAQYDPALFARAASWLYLMETRSSNEIESETPSPNRSERFVQCLRAAGEKPLAEVLSLDALTELQEFLVDPKRRVPIGLRNFQNYVGGASHYGNPRVAYPCPPPMLAAELLEALPDTVARTEGWHAVVRAAVASFGFVYIHPFEDGNGRISRYLIHDLYTRDKLVPSGFIFPVSAIILKRLKEYEDALDEHSRPIRELADHDFDPMDHKLILHNAAVLEPLYRYPNLTAQAKFLMSVTRECTNEALVHELDHLDRMDRARRELRETLDIEDRRLNLLLAMIHQNSGKLSRTKRQSQFLDLDDGEVAQAEQCYANAFNELVESDEKDRQSRSAALDELAMLDRDLGL